MCTLLLQEELHSYMAKGMDIVKSEKFGPLMHSATMCYSDTLPGFAKCKDLIKCIILELFFKYLQEDILELFFKYFTR